MIHRSIIFAVLITLVLGMSSCLEDPDCTPQGNNLARMSFYDIEAGEPLSLNIDSLYVLQEDSIWLQNTILDSYDFELNPGFNEYYFELYAGDTIGGFTFVYDRVPKLYAEPCDIVFLYANFDIKYSSFDSIAVRPETEPVEIEIYF